MVVVSVIAESSGVIGPVRSYVVETRFTGALCMVADSVHEPNHSSLQWRVMILGRFNIKLRAIPSQIPEERSNYQVITSPRSLFNAKSATRQYRSIPFRQY